LLCVDRLRDIEISREIGNLNNSFESVGRECDIHITNSVHTEQMRSRSRKSHFEREFEMSREFGYLVDSFESYKFNQSSKYHQLFKYHQLCTHRTMRSRSRKSHLRELDMSREFGYLVDSENFDI